MPDLMKKMLEKQLLLIEIEIGDYRIAKNQGYEPMYPEVYYANLAHAYQGFQRALDALNNAKKFGVIHVH